MAKVNEETCIGCGACASICEGVFGMKDGKSHVKKGQDKSGASCVKEAAESCPVKAIKL